MTGPDDVSITITVEVPGVGRAEVSTWHPNDSDGIGEAVARDQVSAVARAMRALLGGEAS